MVFRWVCWPATCWNVLTDGSFLFDATLFDLFGVLQGPEVILQQKRASQLQRAEITVIQKHSRNPIQQADAAQKLQHTNPLKKCICILEQWTGPPHQPNVVLYKVLLKQDCRWLIAAEMSKRSTDYWRDPNSRKLPLSTDKNTGCFLTLTFETL